MSAGSHPMPNAGADGRDRLVESALHLFATRSPGRTSTKAITDHAGVAHGLLFYHFTSKDELLRRVLVERTFAPELATLVPETATDSAGLLHAVGTAFVRLLRAHDEYITVLVSTREVAPDLYEAFQVALDEAAEELAVRLLDVAQIRRTTARTGARAYLGALWTSVLVFPSSGSDRALVRRTANLVLGALDN